MPGKRAKKKERNSRPQKFQKPQRPKKNGGKVVKQKFHELEDFKSPKELEYRKVDSKKLFEKNLRSVKVVFVKAKHNDMVGTLDSTDTFEAAVHPDVLNNELELESTTKDKDGIPDVIEDINTDSHEKQRGETHTGSEDAKSSSDASCEEESDIAESNGEVPAIESPSALDDEKFESDNESEDMEVETQQCTEEDDSKLFYLDTSASEAVVSQKSVLEILAEKERHVGSKPSRASNFEPLSAEFNSTLVIGKVSMNVTAEESGMYASFSSSNRTGFQEDKQKHVYFSDNDSEIYIPENENGDDAEVSDYSLSGEDFEESDDEDEGDVDLETFMNFGRNVAKFSQNDVHELILSRAMEKNVKRHHKVSQRKNNKKGTKNKGNNEISDKMNLNDKYPSKMHVKEMVKELEDFVNDMSQTTLSFPPLDTHGCSVVSKLANCYNLKSRVLQQGKQRHTVAIKTKYTYRKPWNLSSVAKIQRQRPIFPRSDRKANEGAQNGGKNVVLEGTVVAHDAPEIGSDNVGRKLLEKLGWTSGSGLGLGNKGIVEPVVAKIKKTKAGIQ